MDAHNIESHQIEVRQEAQALLNGRFTVRQATALVRLREAWKPQLAEECQAPQRASAALAFARWLYRNRVLHS